jgi:acyl-CoA synthetase (AMP-forming)/AMP-acid ligase II
MPSSNPLADIGRVAASEETCLESRITLYTSGTTGVPKPVCHRLLDVIAGKRVGESAGRWLLTFAPFRWAGISVLLHAIKADAEIVVPCSLNPKDIVQAGIQERATHASMTPSLFRKLQLAVSNDDLKSLPFVQVTFGGEAASQSVLSAASKMWPGARISHVYAATEFGDICSISDRLAGVPEAKFQSERFRFEADGELVIDGRHTGDFWALRAGRYHFVGRLEELINVGGAKVSPLEVENAALSIPGIDEARAYGAASPLLGQVVVLDYCGATLEAELQAKLRTLLPKVARPVSIHRVDDIKLTSAGKTDRVRRK